MMQYQNIEGVEDVRRRLLRFPQDLQLKVLRNALRAGAVVYRKGALVEVPVKKGVLRKSVRISTRSKRGAVMAAVKVGGADAYYAHIVHGGSKPHIICPRRKFGVLRVGGVFARRVQHPGARPNPFMKRALDRGSNEALAAVTQYLREHLPEAVAP